MKSKKMWQAFAVICGFMLLAASIAWTVRAIFPDYTGDKSRWGIPFGIGVVFMIASIILSAIRGRLPRSAWAALLFNSIACGLFVGAYLIGKGLGPLYGEIVAAALAPAAFFLVLMAALSVPKLKEKRWYIILCSILWVAALFGGGVAAWGFVPIGGNRWVPYICLLLFSIAVTGLALGALLSADSLWELLYGMVTPSTVCLGFIAVIVLVALACGDGGDCDCGGGCCDGCDCSPGYGSGKKTKRTTMSELGGKIK